VKEPTRLQFVIAAIPDLPPGVLGFKATGKITGGEYRDMMKPIYDLLEKGGPVNLLFVVGDDFSGLDLEALWEDMKAGGSVGLKHRSAWRRMALVTNKDWIRYGAAGFGWLAPGELRVFDLDKQADAVTWLAEGGV
jgi:hypothetical protein